MSDYQLLSVMLEKHGGIDALWSHELGNQMAVQLLELLRVSFLMELLVLQSILKLFVFVVIITMIYVHTIWLVQFISD